jgi:hypothetical protein
VAFLKAMQAHLAFATSADHLYERNLKRALDMIDGRLEPNSDPESIKLAKAIANEISKADWNKLRSLFRPSGHCSMGGV